MKKMQGKKKALRDLAMRREYHFDYQKARANRFASKAQNKTVAVVLDSDVAMVFHDSASVNTLLRSVLAAWPR